jgi:hypothetical protein
MSDILHRWPRCRHAIDDKEKTHGLARTLSDIAAIEAVALSERALPESTYAALVNATQRSADAKALSFFLSTDRLNEPHVWTYAEVSLDVTRAEQQRALNATRTVKQLQDSGAQAIVVAENSAGSWLRSSPGPKVRHVVLVRPSRFMNGPRVIHPPHISSDWDSAFPRPDR